jgi:hypothetical protein
MGFLKGQLLPKCSILGDREAPILCLERTTDGVGQFSLGAKMVPKRESRQRVSGLVLLVSVILKAKDCYMEAEPLRLKVFLS